MKLFYTAILLVSTLAVPALAADTLTSVDQLNIQNGTSQSKLTTNDNKTLSNFYMTNGTSLSDSDFTGATITSEFAIIYGDNDNKTTITSVKFNDMSFTSNRDYVIAFGRDNTGYDTDVVTLTDVDFSGGTYETKTDGAATQQNAFVLYHTTFNNVSFDDVNITLHGSEYSLGFWLSSANVQSSSFKNMTLSVTESTADVDLFYVSGNGNNWTTLSDVDFSGTKIVQNGVETLFNENHIAYSASGSQSEIQNIILGDGKIYSTGMIYWDDKDEDKAPNFKDADGNYFADDYQPVNKGIILQSSTDVLTVQSDLYLDVSSTLTAGQLIFDGGTLELKEGTVLTLICSDSLEIVINQEAYAESSVVEGGEGQITFMSLDIDLMEADAGEVTIDLSELIIVGEGTENVTIAVMDEAGNILTGDAALLALQDQLTVYDTDGNVVENIILTDDNSYISNSIPEPSTATLSLLALAGICIRRRRKAA